METTISDAITILARKAGGEATPDGAMKFAQAAQNLAHILGTLANVRLMEKDRTGTVTE